MAENKKDQELSEQELSNVAGGKAHPGSGLEVDPSSKRKGSGLGDQGGDVGDKDRDTGLGSNKR